jgi:hypothetical protein
MSSAGFASEPDHFLVVMQSSLPRRGATEYATRHGCIIQPMATD